MTYRFQMQCPHCRALCAGHEPPEAYQKDQAVLCKECGNVSVIMDDYMLEKSSDDDVARWMCRNPIAWERVEMMAAEFKRRAERRKGDTA